MIRRQPTVTAVLIQALLVALPLLLRWPAGAQDAAPADRNAINTGQILSKILMAFWTAAEPAPSNVRVRAIALPEPPGYGCLSSR